MTAPYAAAQKEDLKAGVGRVLSPRADGARRAAQQINTFVERTYGQSNHRCDQRLRQGEWPVVHGRDGEIGGVGEAVEEAMIAK